MDRRREHLRLLAIFHFVLAGLVVALSLVPVFWLLLASLWWPELAAEAGREESALPLLASGALGAALVSVGVLLAWIWAGVLVAAGRSLLVQRRYTFCLVVAAVACLKVPLGTALGVATLFVLNRDEVRRLFGVAGDADAPPA